MWGDEMRLGLRGRVCKVWAPRGAAVSQEVQIGWKYIYVAVAIDPLTGRLWWACPPTLKSHNQTGLVSDGHPGAWIIISRAGLYPGSSLKLQKLYSYFEAPRPGVRPWRWPVRPCLVGPGVRVGHALWASCGRGSHGRTRVRTPHRSRVAGIGTHPPAPPGGHAWVQCCRLSLRPRSDGCLLLQGLSCRLAES